jgi:hypothetical protein
MDSMPATLLRRTRNALCLTLVALAAAPVAAQAAAPANDDLANAQVVRVADRATGTVVDATTEVGEPATTSPLVDHTVWYRLDAAASERVRIDTCGSDRYAELAVYTGTDVTTLTEVTSSVRDCAGGGRVYLDAVASTTYFIRVGGYDWGTSIVLDLGRPRVPANDDFANAVAIGVPASVAGSTVDATIEPGEIDPSASGSGHSVWYTLTPATADALRISLVDCGDISGTVSQLTVYTGDSLGSLTEVGEPAPACGQRWQVTLFPRAGTTYRIAVRGAGHAADPFTLHVGLVPSPPDSGPPGVPNPKCPFPLAAPGSVTYRGTHSGGGEVCVTLKPDFSGVSWFHLVDPPRDLCIPFAVESFTPALAIVARRFDATTSMGHVTGTFEGRSVSGTYRAAIPPGGAGICSGRAIAWTAATQATPPAALSDATPPLLRLRGATTQRPLRSGSVKVDFRCPLEACAASASATIAGDRLTSASRNARPGVVKTLTVRLPARARRSIRRALLAKRAVRVRVAVVAIDPGANRTAVRRTIVLRR